jgi:hypothetical protein
MNASVSAIRHSDPDEDFLMGEPGAQAGAGIRDANAFADSNTDSPSKHLSSPDGDDDAEAIASAEPPAKKKGVMVYFIGLVALVVVVVVAIVSVIILNKPRAQQAESSMMTPVAPESSAMPATIGGGSPTQPFAPIEASPTPSTSPAPMGGVSPPMQPMQPIPATPGAVNAVVTPTPITQTVTTPKSPVESGLAGKVDEQALEIATLKAKVATLEAQVKELLTRLSAAATSVVKAATPAAPKPVPAPEKAANTVTGPTSRLEPAPANAAAWELRGIAGARGLIGSATQPLLTVMVGDNVPGLGVVKKVDADKGEIQFANTTLR